MRLVQILIPSLTVASVLLCLTSPAAATAASFHPRSRAEIDRLPLEVTLALLEERGLSCQDCSRQDAAEELLAWQTLPVLKQSQQGQKEGRGVRDEANVAEALAEMQRSGFGRPSSFVHKGQDGFDAEDLDLQFPGSPSKNTRARKARRKSKK